MFCGKIEVLAQYDEILAVLGRETLKSFPDLRRALRQVIGTDAESLTIKVPAVAVLRRSIGTTKSGIKFSKINVCQRDGFTCQYCGNKLPMSQLNYDHVIPRSQGGKTVWTNIVTACYTCNSKKANRTPEQAGMVLLRVPVKPKTLPMTPPIINPELAPTEWLPYLETAA
jgi:5-methylcytosine-specific restriction endonuclease McrA